MIAVGAPCAQHFSILHVNGPLQVPRHANLRDDVRARLLRGERCLVLDLAAVTSIDAGGVGELVRAYTMVAEADGVLRVARPNGWVLETLERAGLASLLTIEAAAA
jgi:anti-anti-sigma factor